MLARDLGGMTAAELRHRMSVRELTDWAGFYRYEAAEVEAERKRAKIQGQHRGRRR